MIDGETNGSRTRGGRSVPAPADAGLPYAELHEAQGEVIGLLADGAPLAEVLARIALLVERLAPPALCSILLLAPDGKHLRAGAAPSLPEAFTRAVDGLEIGPEVGSCGSAAFLKHPVIVTDIATDPKWEGARDFALSFGLRACWSLPIVGEGDVVLGTVAMYYRTPREPSERDRLLLAPAARLARLALAQARKEQALRESDARWRLAAEASDLGTYDVDLVTGESEWSARLRAILGVSEDARAGYESFRERIHPDEVRYFESGRLDNRADPATGVLRDIEVRILRGNDGAERIIRMKGRVLYSAEGLATRAIGTIADITEQRRYERELAAATIAAERANKAKSDFLASMSHELRTPLNAIIGFSDFIRQCTLGPISPGRYRDYVEDIHASGRHLLNLINDVLDMAKIEAGKIELTPEPLRLLGVAEDAMRFVEPQATAAGITLAMQVGSTFALSADRRALVQILTNLLSNGVKFTRPGGHVTVFAERMADGGIALGVEDTGIGMTVEEIETAIEPFGQVDRMVTIEGRGSGLGLPLVEALLKAHGARFRIESTVGLGTRVWGEFPPSSVVRERAVA